MNIPSTSTDLILHNGTVTTLDRSNPIATAVAIRDGKFPRVGTDADVRNVRSISPRIRSVRWLGDRCKGTPKWFSYLTPGVFAAALTVIGVGEVVLAEYGATSTLIFNAAEAGGFIA